MRKRKNRKNLIRRIIFAIVLTVVMAGGAGCVKKKTSTVKSGTKSTQEETTAALKNYSYDMVIITKIDTTASQITVKRLNDSDTRYILNYTRATGIKSRYGSQILVSALSPGDIAQVTYVPGTQKLTELELSGTAWKNDSVTKWVFDYTGNTMTIGDSIYRYSDDLFIYSAGKTISVNEIDDVDTLEVSGVGDTIYSITVKTGHGYVRLADYSDFVGGIVDVGGKIVKLITEDMTLVVPEGEQTLSASKNGVGGSTTVTVIRGAEIIVSLSDFDRVVEKNGALNLHVYPENTVYTLYVDGTQTQVDGVLDLSYGSHTLKIISSLYDDYTTKVTISSIYSTLSVDLSADTEETSVSEDSVSDEGQTTAAAESGKVTVTAPEGADMYVDGTLVGTIPLTMDKISGSHVIILRQTGYNTVVYNVDYSEDDSSATISFLPMEESD